jgi:hypothetical protein
VIVLAREDAEIHLHAIKTTNEQLHPCKRWHCHLRKLHRCSETIMQWMNLFVQLVHMLPFSNSIINGKSASDKMPLHFYPNYDRISPCWVSLLERGIPNCSPNADSSWWPFRAFTRVWCPGFIIVIPKNIWALLSAVRSFRDNLGGRNIIIWII